MRLCTSAVKKASLLRRCLRRSPSTSRDIVLSFTCPILSFSEMQCNYWHEISEPSLLDGLHGANSRVCNVGACMHVSDPYPNETRKLNSNLMHTCGLFRPSASRNAPRRGGRHVVGPHGGDGTINWFSVTEFTPTPQTRPVETLPILAASIDHL